MAVQEPDGGVLAAAQCQAAVAKYPFSANGPPVGLDEFAKVFGPGGALDGAYNTQLKSYIDSSAKPWKPQATAAGLLGAADAQNFQRAAAIRDAFFPGAKATPSVQFDVEPAGAVPATLDLGGAAVVLIHARKVFH